MTESSELKEADLLDATACLYKLGTDKACHRWSFMLKRERTATSIAEFKSYLILNHGFKEVATSFGIMKFSTKISIHRHMKEPQFPNGRIFVLVPHTDTSPLNTIQLDYQTPGCSKEYDGESDSSDEIPSYQPPKTEK